jgi:hypothetical protein
MKFFTREWCQGEMPDEEWAEVIPAYEKHLDKITPLLTNDLHKFVKDYNLHDSLIHQVYLSRYKALLQITLLCGDLQRGYSDLVINYQNVDFDRFDQKALSTILQNPQSELHYDEIDVGDEGQFTHRMIFYPKGELTVVFSNLSFSMTERDNRVVELDKPRLVEEK